MMERWRESLSKAGIALDSRTQEAIQELGEAGQLSVGWPDSKLARHQDCLVWRRVRSKSPNLTSPNLMSRKLTSIVSSRLGRNLDGKDTVFRVVRQALAQLDPRSQSVLTVRGTATNAFISRACELFGVDTLDVEVARPRTSLFAWANSLLKGPTDDVCHVFDPDPDKKLPLRDSIEVHESDQLLVLHARHGGNLEGLLRSRLTEQDDGKGRMFLAMGAEHLVPRDVAQPLMDRGALGWLLMGDDSRQCPLIGHDAKPIAPILTELPNPERFLTHCTRRSKGAWPDQDADDYLNELILGAPTKDRSSLAALGRIVSMQKLLASELSIRGAARVVSFTAATLTDLHSMRVFRPHRGRWDFEPYGISIDVDWLVKRGAREVVYGDDKLWQEMSTEDRPFFQKSTSDSIDWTVEKEWRVPGDLDLAEVPTDGAVVFVPNESEARHIAQVSRWPVVILRPKNGP